MTKLIYSTIMSLDGYVADENGAFDWAEPGDDVHLCWPLRSSEPTSIGHGRVILISSRVTRHERPSLTALLLCKIKTSRCGQMILVGSWAPLSPTAFPEAEGHGSMAALVF